LGQDSFTEYTAGDRLTFQANGFPDPDQDCRISRSYNPETGGCVTSEQPFFGPPFSFTWRLWRDEDGDGVRDRNLRVIGYGREISWQAPMEAGVYWIELIVDDDGNPGYDAPPQKVECGKCTVYSNSDDPTMKDWVKVNVIPVRVQLSIHPDEPSTLSADDGECFIVMGVWVFNPEIGDGCSLLNRMSNKSQNWSLTDRDKGRY